MVQKVIFGKDLKPYERYNWEGDYLIKGDVPDGITIIGEKGNLKIDGNLGDNVKLENWNNVAFQSSGKICNIVVWGRIDFDVLGSGKDSIITSVLSGSHITGNKTGEHTRIFSTEGDINIENVGSSNKLDSQNDIIFKELAEHGHLIAAGSVYHEAKYSTDTKISAKQIIPRPWNGKSPSFPPATQVNSTILDAQRAAALNEGQGI